jgi:hypothetical protein
MKRLIVAALLLLGAAPCQTASEGKGGRIVLPNPKLLRCVSSDCFSLWLEKSQETNAVFPKQFIIDMDQNCLYGFRVVYDKSIPVEDVRAALDERYGTWTVPGFENSSLKLWRVEPEKFAIQLHVNDKKDEKRNLGDAGTKEAIYLAFAFRGKSACSNP